MSKILHNISHFLSFLFLFSITQIFSFNSTSRFKGTFFYFIFVSLQLSLDNNNIKFLNANTIKRLPKLKKLNLLSNVCISQSLNSASDIIKFYNVLDEKCAFNEAFEICHKNAELKDKQTELKVKQTASILKTKDEEIARLKQTVQNLLKKVELLYNSSP